MPKVLITGGCGFLGSHLCEYYKKKGWEVLAYDNLTKYETSRIQFGNQDKIRDYNYNYLESLGIPIIAADIRDSKTLEKYSNRCNLIINAAAQPAMTLSCEDPMLDFAVNVLGVLNLLEICRRGNIPFINCSTIHIYGTGINDTLIEGIDEYKRSPKSIDEGQPVLTGQLTPLHASKRSAEIYIQTYIDTYNIRAAIFRLTGIYGPRQFGSEDHGWVSLLAIKTMLGLPIELIGNGKQVRDILYIDDAVRAFDAWYTNGKHPGVYNIGGGQNNIISVLQCISNLGLLFERQQEINPGGTRFGDLLYFVCDNRKAFRTFKWRPTIQPWEGLVNLTRWLKELKGIF